MYIDYLAKKHESECGGTHQSSLLLILMDSRTRTGAVEVSLALLGLVQQQPHVPAPEQLPAPMTKWLPSGAIPTAVVDARCHRDPGHSPPMLASFRRLVHDDR